MKQHRGVLIATLLGIITLACAIPGLQPASSIPPTPDTRLERMVAETVSAALVLTQQAAPTATEVPSATPVPTITNTPVVAATSTQSAESVLDKNTDGTSSFIDLNGKYQMTVPMQWLVLRINAPEYDIALTLPEASDPAIQRQFSIIKEQDPNVFRLFMLDIAEEHIDNGFVTNINLVWDQQMEVSLASDTDIKGIAATLPASLQGAQVKSTEIKTTKSEIMYGVITILTPLSSQNGAKLTVYQKMAFFDLPTGTLTVTLSTTEKWQSTVEPSFDELIESFIVLE
ncbi:MAG: hypothetical protein HYU84_01985 [Chloroflexi bacterium]|nr:hypothetical protein [Chloroflexota bacterium]MBI3170702.1 hypothetical protein [Chloroflexota bacterium]